MAVADFLPQELVLEGSWERVLIILYKTFYDAFVCSACSHRSQIVLYDKNKTRDNKEACFWHLIERDDHTSGRVPDYKRARRLNWIKPVIENDPHPAITYFEWQSRRGRKRFHLWLKELDYVVVLEEGRKPGIVFLITAFIVDKFKKRDFEKRCSTRP